MGRPPATRPVGAGETYTGGTRAFDIKSGKTLWSFHLPAGGNVTPITYMGNEGRQYVVIAAADHGGIRSCNGDEVIAFALPSSGN
jgi:quinoprotein glucose dehydrogenase